MMRTHEVTTSVEHFKAIEAGIKCFDIRKNDRDYQVDDILLIQAHDGAALTGETISRQINYMTDDDQRKGYIVMGLKTIPYSFKDYIALNPKEQAVFQHIVSHMHLYGLNNRDVINTFWDIIEDLLGHRTLDEDDQNWYLTYWNKLEADKLDEEDDLI